MTARTVIGNRGAMGTLCLAEDAFAHINSHAAPIVGNDAFRNSVARPIAQQTCILRIENDSAPTIETGFSREGFGSVEHELKAVNDSSTDFSAVP